LDSAARLIPAAGSRMVLATHPGQDPPWLCMSCPCRSVTRIPHAYCMPGAYCTAEPSASLPGQHGNTGTHDPLQDGGQRDIPPGCCTRSGPQALTAAAVPGPGTPARPHAAVTCFTVDPQYDTVPTLNGMPGQRLSGCRLQRASAPALPRRYGPRHLADTRPPRSAHRVMPHPSQRYRQCRRAKAVRSPGRPSAPAARYPLPGWASVVISPS
jgi:hypothetical protein